eukprot:TRINITY_DN2949_c3_g1_i1.p1 TRINITY_DN2949_c3_g1~~TRINITY_DN2949_c3_g1_i1.p1  ORF type:complete len:475 (+),score=102.06 TRINITY_DN2949_c3_g1_i1:48-1427(+)
MELPSQQAARQITEAIDKLKRIGGGNRIILVTGPVASGKTWAVKEALRNAGEEWVVKQAKGDVLRLRVTGNGKVITVADPLESLLGRDADAAVLREYSPAHDDDYKITIVTLCRPSLLDVVSPEINALLATCLHHIDVPSMKAAHHSLLAALLGNPLTGLPVKDQTIASLHRAVSHPAVCDTRDPFKDRQNSAATNTAFHSFGSLQDDLIKLVKTMNPTSSAMSFVTPSGILLTGVSGCGKTSLARSLEAPLTELGVGFRWVDAAGLFNSWLGETEAKIREIFTEARAASPCMVVIDDIDAVGRRRDGAESDDAGSASVRGLSSLLCELDGIGGNKGVMVVGLTSLPWLLDSALLRQGRLEKLILINPPDETDRAAILKALATKMSLAPDVDIDAIAASTVGHTPAALRWLLRTAGLQALATSSTHITLEHINNAMADIPAPPSPPLLLRFSNFIDSKP